MPGGANGFDLARSARARWPALKIVLTSGFPAAGLERNDAAIPGLLLLSKPYRKNELARLLREALGSGVAAG